MNRTWRASLRWPEWASLIAADSEVESVNPDTITRQRIARALAVPIALASVRFRPIADISEHDFRLRSDIAASGDLE